MVSKSVLVAVTISFLTQPVLAQGAEDAAIQNEFSNFSAGLDSQSQEMQSLRDNSASNAASTNLTNMQANEDTENAANQAFQNGQEQMLNSGGAYNSQGFVWGSPWGGMGGFGGGGGSALGSNMVPSLPSTSWSGEPLIRGPKEGYNGVLKSYYNSARPARRWSIGQ